MNYMPNMENDTPFPISPDPTALFFTSTIKSATLKVDFTVRKRQGLSAILGDVGIGKSSLLRYFYARYAAQDGIHTAFITTKSKQSTYSFLVEACRSLDIAPKKSFPEQLEFMNERLLEYYDKGENSILFVDEANLLTKGGLEVIRALLNFENFKHKMIQIVIAGQLDLKARIERKDAKPIRSRISTYSLLDPLTLDEVRGMLIQRCDRAAVPFLFTQHQLEEIYILTRGVPRAVLKLCALAYDFYEQTGQLPALDSLATETGEHTAELVAANG